MKTKPIFESEAIETLNAANMMTTSLIQELVNNYRNNHLMAINSTLEITDAHSIWFDLPKLKKFIADIEIEAQKVNPDTTENDLGIRFYYAAYPKLENWDIMESHPVPTEYAEKHTLIMIPTLKSENEEGELLDYDFNPLSAVNGQMSAMAFKSSNADDPEEDESLAQNHGQLIPPATPVVQMY
ncbi:hypothetical protein [Chryseobacterium populi]|uniref:Uncharacterized protein n=1 Tax=Chryseobacterium populi TaxID=1144316 RepID=J2SR69_9FLAO|nr:hypothetical protein [Chryseobacterium populi]EJL68022.1 hypothetical protein PMI13_03980 [Chryseobacterium populi]